MFRKILVLVSLSGAVFFTLPASAQELQSVDLGLQLQPYIPVWKPKNMENIGAIGTEVFIHLAFGSPTQGQHGPYISYGGLYVRGRDNSTNSEASRIIPIYGAGYQMFFIGYGEKNGFLGRVGGILTTGGFGGELSFLHQWTIKGPDSKFFGGVAMGYLQTGLEPGDRELRYPFLGVRLGWTGSICTRHFSDC